MAYSLLDGIKLQIKMNSKEKEIYNVDTAWNKLHNRFEQDGLLDNDTKIRKIDVFMMSKIAAVFIVGAFLSYFAYNYINKKMHLGMQLVETYSDTQIRRIELPDGSVVHLNSKSNLYYPKSFTGKKRIIEFEGEAFFEIKKNPEKPFYIIVGNKEIRVLGTSFNVNTNFTSGKVEVLVKTGKVKFYEPGKSKKELILEPGSIGAIDEKSAVKKLIDDPNYLSWKTKYFDFSKGERLDKVIATINKAYGVNIVLENPELAKRTIATVYDNKSLDMVLILLCQSHTLETEVNGDTIILKEK